MDTRIDTFLTRARLVADSRNQARALCRDELRAIDHDYATENGRRVRITAYRNALRAVGLTKYFLTALRLPKVRAQALKVAYDTLVVSRGMAQQPINSYQALIDKALSLLESRAYGDVLVGLALLSGRRPAELCVTGDFCEVEGDTESLWFTGQAKTKQEDGGEQPYQIPLLCDAPRFLQAWTRFITMRDFSVYASTVPGQSVSPKFKQTGCVFGASYDRHFAPLMPSETSVRHLRDAYGLICFHTKSPGNVAINLYLKRILGHTDSKGETAQSYQKFYLAEYTRPTWEN